MARGVQILRRILETAGLDEMTSVEDLNSRDVRFQLEVYTGRGKGKAVLSWGNLGSSFVEIYIPSPFLKLTTSFPGGTVQQGGRDFDHHARGRLSFTPFSSSNIPPFPFRYSAKCIRL